MVVLTAACLHLGAGTGPEPTLEDLRRLLEGLGNRADQAIAALAASPMAFTQYAAAELRADSNGTWIDAVDLAVRAVSGLLDETSP